MSTLYVIISSLEHLFQQSFVSTKVAFAMLLGVFFPGEDLKVSLARSHEDFLDVLGVDEVQ